MKTSSDVIAAINALEQAFPVSSWRLDDIDLWPSYRLRLYGAAIDGLLLTHPPPRGLPRWRGLATRASRSLWRVPLAAWRDRRANAPVRPGTTAAFLSDGVSFTRLDGQWFDRVIDPVMQGLQERGLHALKLTPLAEAHVPRNQPSIFVQPTIDRIKLLATRHRIEPELAEFDSLVAAGRQSFGTMVPSREWLRVQAARLQALSRWFGGALQRSEASHAFVNTWYSLEGQAFVMAANRLGMRAIDLQHGMQGSQHVAYSNWLTVPVEGYSTLPNEFWVWGQEEAVVIDAWATRTARHSARVTGNYWLQQWRDDGQPLVRSFLAQACALRGNAVTQVLVGLTWGVAEEETEKLMEAARLCGNSVSWWWRLHPVESGRRAEFAARLARCGLDASCVSEATDLPLYALVRNADLTVAHSSTLIREAAEFGVPSVVTSDYGAAMHADLVRNGMALRALDSAAIAHAVTTLAKRPRQREAALSPQGPTLSAALDELLGSKPPHHTEPIAA